MLLAQRIDGKDFGPQPSPLAVREFPDVGVGDRSQVEQRLAIQHHLGAGFAVEERGEVRGIDDPAVSPIGGALVLGERLGVTPDEHAVVVEPDRHWRPNMLDRHRILVALDGDERLATDPAGAQKAVVVGRVRQDTALGGFVGQPVIGGEVGGPRWARVHRHQPRGLLAFQVGIVSKVASRQEVPLDVLDE